MSNRRYTVQPQHCAYAQVFQRTRQSNKGGGRSPFRRRASVAPPQPTIPYTADHASPAFHNAHTGARSHEYGTLLPQRKFSRPRACAARAHPLLPLCATPPLAHRLHRRFAAASVFFNLSERTERAIPLQYQAGPKAARVSAGATVPAVVSVGRQTPPASTRSRCCCLYCRRRQRYRWYRAGRFSQLGP